MSKSNNWFEAFKDDPQAILDWCDAEIKEYQNLKKLITKELSKKSKK